MTHQTAVTIGMHALLAIWALALGTTIWASWLARRRLSTPPPHLDAPFGLYPVTILKPLKGADSGLLENLECFFRLDYPKYELIFSVADGRDPAHEVVSKLISKYPSVPARLIVGDVQLGPNPKVNNLAKSYAQAKYDWLLISDSNVRVQPDYVKRLVAHLDSSVGIVTSMVAGQNPELTGGRLEACYLNTFYAKGMVAAFALGQPLVIGKSMLFRKSTCERFGGIPVLAQYLAEDYICGEAIRQLGLRVVMAADPIAQHIGSYSFKSFWQRHIRWGRIRKVQAPLPFLLEPFLGCFISLALGAVAVKHLSGIPLSYFAAAHLSVWAACDYLLMRRLGQKTEIKLPIIWFMRELLSIPMWFHIASGNTVDWRGRKLKLQAGGLLEVPTV